MTARKEKPRVMMEGEFSALTSTKKKQQSISIFQTSSCVSLYKVISAKADVIPSTKSSRELAVCEHYSIETVLVTDISEKVATF
jgi:hypothetical protein